MVDGLLPQVPKVLFGELSRKRVDGHGGLIWSSNGTDVLVALEDVVEAVVGLHDRWPGHGSVARGRAAEHAMGVVGPADVFEAMGACPVHRWPLGLGLETGEVEVHAAVREPV